VTMVAVIPARIGTGKSYGRFISGPAIVFYLAFAKFLLHLLTAGRYGIFRMGAENCIDKERVTE
jgi:hypothetical protein